MDPLPSGVSGGPSPLAGNNRSLCDSSESQASSLLPADVRPSIGGHGCHDAVLGRPSGLRLSPLQVAPSGHCQGQAIAGVGTHLNSSILDATHLVSRPAAASGRGSGLPSTAEGFTQTSALHRFHQNLPVLRLIVSLVERSARHFGFSTALALQLAHCRRASTHVNYQAKWTVYRAWSRRHGHSISRPSVPKVASFLLY